MQKKILVTGANGFVGSQLCQYLTRQGRDICRAVHSVSDTNDTNVIKIATIDDTTDWHDTLVGIDTIIHLAGRVHVMHELSPNPLAVFRQVNVEGTLNLARQAGAVGIKRFIYLSSIKVNGEETTNHPFTEDDSIAPRHDPYGQSKFEAETGLFELARQTGLEVIIIRPPLIYGPGVKANFLKIMHWLSLGVPLPLGAIHNKRSLVAMENLVDLIATCVEHPAAANQVFLAGDGYDLSTTELLRRLAAALQKPAYLLPVPQRLLVLALKTCKKGAIAQRLCGSLQVDISKARAILGWAPPISVDEGLKRTAEWYLRHG